jgi:phage tail protein X
MPIFEGSRYEGAGLYNREGVGTIRVRYIDRTPLGRPQYYQLVEGDTLDRLSYRFYGDSQYWWILADYNPALKFPYNPLPAGITIQVPDLYLVLEKMRGE